MIHDRTDVYTRITAEIVAAIEAAPANSGCPGTIPEPRPPAPPIASGKGLAASTSSLCGSPPKSPATTTASGAPSAVAGARNPGPQGRARHHRRAVERNDRGW